MQIEDLSDIFRRTPLSKRCAYLRVAALMDSRSDRFRGQGAGEEAPEIG